MLFFFFQAEDGIRDVAVTGVQTCALPIFVSAKHGQSPLDRSQLRLIDDGEVIGAVNAAWAAANPTGVNPLVVFGVDDDGMLLWLADRSEKATSFVQSFLWGYTPQKAAASAA